MESAPLLLLRNADVHAPQALGRRDLLLGGGKVLWMGESVPDMPASLGVEVLDLEGARLVPGFIDGHVHASGGGGEAGFASRVPAPGLSRYTVAGVTTIIALLGTDDVARGIPELLSHVYGLREQGLGAWAYCGGYHLPPATLTGTVRGDLAFAEPLIGVGEVAISGPFVMREYWNRPEATEAVRHGEWFLTGDIGRMDEDGDLWIAGVDGKNPQRVLKGNFLLPAWSDDGRQIAVAERKNSGRKWEISIVTVPRALLSR